MTTKGKTVSVILHAFILIQPIAAVGDEKPSRSDFRVDTKANIPLSSITAQTLLIGPKAGALNHEIAVYVRSANQQTNSMLYSGYRLLPIPNRCQMTLRDNAGKLVPKTRVGGKIGSAIRGVSENVRIREYVPLVFFQAFPFHVETISIDACFRVPREGDYELEVKVALLQRDGSGKYEPMFLKAVTKKLKLSVPAQ